MEIFDALKHKFDLVGEGWKISLIAYGMTGSGKTHTMIGNNDGLIVNAVKYI